MRWGIDLVYAKLDPKSIEIRRKVAVIFMDVTLGIGIRIYRSLPVFGKSPPSHCLCTSPWRKKGREKSLKSWLSWHATRIDSDLVFFLVSDSTSQVLEELNYCILCLLFLINTPTLTRWSHQMITSSALKSNWNPVCITLLTVFILGIFPWPQKL